MKQKLLRTIAGEKSSSTPIWLMRQAGRYLPEYRALREKAGSFMKLCLNPEMAAAVTLQPIVRYDLDAAIIFADILLVPYGLGADLHFAEGEGPVLSRLDLHQPWALDDSFLTKLNPTLAALGLVRARLAADKTLIGFAGGPWTVACYWLEGRGRGNFSSIQQLLQNAPDVLERLLYQIAEATAQYLLAQINAGADCLQLFESWAGLLAGQPDNFARFIIGPNRWIIEKIRAHRPVPIIGFPRLGGISNYTAFWEQTKVDVLACDTEISISQMSQWQEQQVTVMGNLDPEILRVGGDRQQQAVANLSRQLGGERWIFNLGHGISQHTPPDHVTALVSQLRSLA